MALATSLFFPIAEMMTSFLVISPTSFLPSTMGTLLKGFSIKHWHVSARLSSGLNFVMFVDMKASTVLFCISVGVPVIKWYAMPKRSFSETMPTSSMFFSTTGSPVILYLTISSRASVTVVSFLTTTRSVCIMFLILSILVILSYRTLFFGESGLCSHIKPCTYMYSAIIRRCFSVFLLIIAVKYGFSVQICRCYFFCV